MSTGRLEDFKFHMHIGGWQKSGDSHPMRVGGIVSTDDLDRQAEVVLQNNLDFTPFLSHGWYNDNHGQKTADVLGYPGDAKRVRKGEIYLPGKFQSTMDGGLKDTFWTLRRVVKFLGFVVLSRRQMVAGVLVFL